MRKLLLIGLALGLAACQPPAPTAAPPAGGETARVVRVIDGDTIDVEIDGARARVRYIGVNTPERDQPCYREATAANADLVTDRTVTLVKDTSETDPNGRLLRYVYVGETFVNALLVEQGFAEARPYPPDTAQADYLEGLEAEARAANRNCHALAAFGAGYTCADGQACIKGNLNAQGQRFYHFPGCEAYDQTRISEAAGERWFTTSVEAEAAGWERAPNCP